MITPRVPEVPPRAAGVRGADRPPPAGGGGGGGACVLREGRCAMTVGSEKGVGAGARAGIGGGGRGSVSTRRRGRSSRRMSTVGSIGSGFDDRLARVMSTVGSVETTSGPPPCPCGAYGDAGRAAPAGGAGGRRTASRRASSARARGCSASCASASSVHWRATSYYPCWYAAIARSYAPSAPGPAGLATISSRHCPTPSPEAGPACARQWKPMVARAIPADKGRRW